MYLASKIKTKDSYDLIHMLATVISIKNIIIFIQYNFTLRDTEDFENLFNLIR